MANYRYVGPAYLDAMRMSLKQGRWFTNADRTREVVVLSERTAQTVFPGQDAVGLRIQAGGSRLPYAEVIGIVSDTRSLKLEREPVLMAYLPWWKRNPPSFALIARTDSEPGLLAAAIRQEVSRVDSEAVVARTRTLERVVQDSLSTRRYQLGLLGLFAASAFALATLGIYGVVSYSVARRRTELGIRLALGAAASDLNRLVLRKGMTPVAIGLAVGLFLALGAGRLVESALFGVTSADPLTYGVVIAALLCASLAACYVPARRVTQTDPSSALRHE
jgi:ABC-type antimicrobial peptide transport system permease subunit